MASQLLSKANLLSSRRAPSQEPLAPSRRRFHVDLGEREKSLLADDPALKNFKSYKPTVRRIGKIGDALTVVVVAACCYEIYQHGVLRTAGYKQGYQSKN